MKILFLDMDGVLNSMPDIDIRKTWKYDKELYTLKLFGIDPDLVKNLKLIIDRTDCKIVFSTSWRYFKDHHIMGNDWRKSLAESLGVSQDIFIGNTPDCQHCGGWDSGVESRRRGIEIKTWLENNQEIAVPGKYRFCVIDDEVSDILSVINESHVVHTDYKTGLQMKDVDRAVRILNGD